MTERTTTLHLTPDIGRSGDTGAIIFVGHARLPQAFGGPSGSTVVTVEAEVDASSGRIVDATCYPASELCARLVRTVLTGRDLRDGLGDAVIDIQRRYAGPAQRAIATAVANVYETYARWSAGGQATTPTPAQSSRSA